MIIIASFHQIKQGNGKLTIYIAERMLTHKHDLIHKAIGWMLREVGKRCSMDELRGFLDQYAPKMPRTMLRYAIEKMDEAERKHYLNKKDA
jgi:3-methyladenine DNA glycosylase AlkD